MTSTASRSSRPGDFPNEMWQSDMLQGPWLPDPRRPKKARRSWLYAFLDDHSRLCLHGRFSFKGDLPALELVFRRSLQKYGVPRRVYYDNGAVYRSEHMRHVVACLGIEGITFTQVRRPSLQDELHRSIRPEAPPETRRTTTSPPDHAGAAGAGRGRRPRAWDTVERDVPARLPGKGRGTESVGSPGPGHSGRY